MNEPELQRSLSEWMHDDRTRASSWVLESVVEHAHRSSNQGWWARLYQDSVLARIGIGRTGRRRAWSGLAFATATAVVAMAIIVTVALFLPAPTDRAPAVAPVTSSPDSSPSASHTPSPDEVVGFPSDGGLVGSLWLQQGDGQRRSYVTLHPDGTIVQVSMGPRQPVGIGTWRPTGERSLTSLVAWPDADPVNHLRPGFSTHRAEWTLDEDGSDATLTWTASLQPADGSTTPDVSGTSTLVRLQRLPLPPEAAYPSPAEPDWELAVGPMVQGPGSGIVVAMMESCEPGVSPEPGALPDYLVAHGDGTAFHTGEVRGNAPGLWIPTGPDTRGLSSWFGQNPDTNLGAWPVAQLAGRSTITVSQGSSEEFYAEAEAEARSLEPMGEPLPAVDPTLWPATGSVWLEPTDVGTAITAYLTDGTVVVRDPRYGTGAGYWQPLDADTITAWVGFSSLESHSDRWSEATTGPDGDTLSISYQHQDTSGGSVETGHATATGLRIEP